MNLPYIMVTGIVTKNDVETILTCYEYPTTHCLAAGILVSHKTLSGNTTTNRRYPTAPEARARIEELSEFNCWPVVHYNTSGCTDPLSQQIDRLMGLHPLLSGIQLNVVKPDPEELKRIKDKHNISLILQVNEKSIRERTAICVCDYVSQYKDTVDYALFDMSGGKSEPLDTLLAANILRYWDFRGIIPSLAGGLGPEGGDTLREIKHFARMIDLRCVSFDAEGKIRVPVPDPIDGQPYQDMLSRDRTVAYVKSIRKAV